MKKVIIILVLSVLAAAFIAGSCGQRSHQQAKSADNENVSEQNVAGKNWVDLFFPLSNEFEWTNFEKQDQELKKRFIQNLPDDFEFYTHYGGGMSNLEAGLHIVDFNGDGLNDIIFNGYLGGEAEYIIIFINTGQSFVKIFTETQKFHKIVIKDRKAHRLYVRDGGCCCDYIGTNKIFSVNYNSELPVINLISQTQFVNISQEEYPGKYFEEPIKFEVLNDRYNIRFSPVINDTTEIGYCGELRYGNSLGKIKSGSIGYALAEKNDSTGRTWWYVAMQPNAEIYESVYYDEKISPNTYKLGWISSRFVKEINNH